MNYVITRHVVHVLTLHFVNTVLTLENMVGQDTSRHQLQPRPLGDVRGVLFHPHLRVRRVARAEGERGL